jgi:flagellar biosynthetic protein FliR
MFADLLPPGTIESFGLVLARTSTLVLSAPVLGSATRMNAFKIVLVVAISAALYPVVGQPVEPFTGGIEYALMMLREVLVGLFLAFLLHLAILAVRVAGQLIGHEMGFMVARQVDPETGIQVPLITSVYETLFLLALLSMNGHHWLLRSLGASFERAPIGSLDLGAGVATIVQSMFGEMFSAGIVFAAPVMVLLTLISILIGLLNRVVQHLNVLEIGFTMRVTIALAAMCLFAPLMEPAMEGLHGALVSWLERGVDALEV